MRPRKRTARLTDHMESINLFMEFLEACAPYWFAASLSPFFVALLWRYFRLRAVSKEKRTLQTPQSLSFVSVMVPIKGFFPGQREILLSLVRQRHPRFEIVFILEDEKDEAFSTVAQLCRRFSHCRLVISGRSYACAQKNHSLIAGIRSLKPATKIIVFCDSGSVASPRWLVSLTRPIETRQHEVVTTFRVFHPDPMNTAGVCQAMYGSFITIAKTLFPIPWGGGTAIRRKTFDRLKVVDRWANTVVDDMVLGNALAKAGIKTKMDVANQLDSPLTNPSLKTFLPYLERQMLFPKFTDMGLWLGGLVLVVNISLAALAAAVLLAGAVLHRSATPAALEAAGFFTMAFLLSFGYWRVSAKVPVFRWLMTLFPAIMMGAAVYVRTIFSKKLLWSGRLYSVGKGGLVLKISSAKKQHG